jgi:hypothetical protein
VNALSGKVDPAIVDINTSLPAAAPAPAWC